MKRGEIYWVNLGNNTGSEQSGRRPVVIIQNDVGNVHAPTTIVCPLTTAHRKKQPTQIEFMLNGKLNVVLGEQIITICKSRFCEPKECIGKLSCDELVKLNKALKVSLSLV